MLSPDRQCQDWIELIAWWCGKSTHTYQGCSQVTGHPDNMAPFIHRFSMVSPGVPGSSFMVTRWLSSSKVTPFQIQAQWEKVKFFFLTKLLRFTLVGKARSSAHLRTSFNGQKHGLLWWTRNASCVLAHLKQRFSSRPHSLRKEAGTINKYWEMGNSFLKTNKPKRGPVFHPLRRVEHTSFACLCT